MDWNVLVEDIGADLALQIHTEWLDKAVCGWCCSLLARDEANFSTH